MYGLLLIPVVILAVVLSSRRSRSLASVAVEGDRVVVRPSGLNKVWSLRGEVEIPLANIVGIDAVARSGKPKGLRAPGTSLPGVFYAGTFRSRDGKAFWLARGGRNPALAIRTNGRPYDVIVVEVPDPDAVVESLRPSLPLAG